jgi:hypothetical protein
MKANEALYTILDMASELELRSGFWSYSISTSWEIHHWDLCQNKCVKMGTSKVLSQIKLVGLVHFYFREGLVIIRKSFGGRNTVMLWKRRSPELYQAGVASML